MNLGIYEDAYEKEGSIRKAAALLGISFSTYARRLKLLREKYGKGA